MDYSVSENASDILELAKKRYQIAINGWQKIYASAKADLDFMSDAPGAQWDPQDFNSRITVNRPVPQIDQLTQFKHQVVNDIRMNTPTINVIPANLDSDPKTAEIIAGRVKAIEYKSNADSAYDMAADFSVGCSIGFIRVDRQYVDDESFEQELVIKRVTNPLAYYLDPQSTEPDGSDAKYAFVIEEMPLDEFKKKWPDATPTSFGDSPEVGRSGTSSSETTINIVEYFTIDTEEDEFGLLPDGSREATKGSRKKYQSRRKIKKSTVRHYKLSAEDILEETTFPGKYIPIVPVYGEEAWNDGERHLFSLIRKAKDAQRTFNLWKSLETELLLKQQQAPVQAAAGQMAGFEEDWANPDKAMVLYYNQTDIKGQPAPAPRRLQPPTIPTGIVNASQSTSNNIREILGMYNAAAGKREGDSSGIALKQLDQSSDVGNFHFGDNLVKSITQVGKIIVCALPEVEDTSRIVSTVDKEDNYKMVGINGAMVPDQERPYDITAGKYDVRVTTGPSFTTQRQEAAQSYNQIIRAMPDLMPIIGDLVFKYQDAPGSDAISARLKKLVDPKLLDDSEREENAPDPQVAQLTAQLQELTAQAQQQIQALQAELQSKQAETQVKMGELQIKAEEVEIKKGELQLKLIQAQKPEAAQPDDSFDKQIKAEELKIKAFDAETKRMAAMQKKPEQTMKLDATGFQYSKTPEAEANEMTEMAIEQQKLSVEQQKLQLEAQEAEARQAQTVAVINGLSGIQQTLGALVQSVQAPVEIIRDQQGNLIGAR